VVHTLAWAPVEERMQDELENEPPTSPSLQATAPVGAPGDFPEESLTFALNTMLLPTATSDGLGLTTVLVLAVEPVAVVIDPELPEIPDPTPTLALTVSVVPTTWLGAKLVDAIPVLPVRAEAGVSDSPLAVEETAKTIGTPF